MEMLIKIFQCSHCTSCCIKAYHKHKHKLGDVALATRLGRQFQGILDAFNQKARSRAAKPPESVETDLSEERDSAWHGNLFGSPKKKLQARWEQVSPSLKEKLQRYSPKALRDLLGEKGEELEPLSTYQENVAAMEDCSQMLAERQSKYKQIAAFYLEDSSPLNQNYLPSASQDNNPYLLSRHEPTYSTTYQIPKQGQWTYLPKELPSSSTNQTELAQSLPLEPEEASYVLRIEETKELSQHSPVDNCEAVDSSDLLRDHFVHNFSQDVCVSAVEHSDTILVSDSSSESADIFVVSLAQKPNELVVKPFLEEQCSSATVNPPIFNQDLVEDNNEVKSKILEIDFDVPENKLEKIREETNCLFTEVVEGTQENINLDVSSTSAVDKEGTEEESASSSHWEPIVNRTELSTRCEEFQKTVNIPEPTKEVLVAAVQLSEVISTFSDIVPEISKDQPFVKISKPCEEESADNLDKEVAVLNLNTTVEVSINNAVNKDAVIEKNKEQFKKTNGEMGSTHHIVVPLPDAHHLRKSPVTVQEWVDHLPVKVKLAEDHIDEPIDRVSMLRCEAATRLSREASVQSSSSLDSLLDARRPDPVEILLNLGFGGSPGIDLENCRIPKRFLIPSKCKGGDWNEFLKRELLQVQNFECASLGFRGLSGPSHQRPSAIVANIMEKLRERAAPRPPPRARFTSVARRVLSETSVLNKLNNHHHHSAPSTSSSVLTPDNRKFLDSQGKISPEVPRRRIIFGQKSFAIDKDGELVEVEPSPSTARDSGASSGGSTQDSSQADGGENEMDHIPSVSELLRMRRSSLQRQRKVEENSDEENDSDLPKEGKEMVIPEIREPGKGLWRLQSSSSLQLVPEDNDDLRGELAAEIETLSRKIQTAPREELAALLEPIWRITPGNFIVDEDMMIFTSDDSPLIDQNFYSQDETDS